MRTFVKLFGVTFWCLFICLWIPAWIVFPVWFATIGWIWDTRNG